MPHNFIKKIKNNENYCSMHLINFIHRCISDECIPIREPIKKRKLTYETQKEYEQQTSEFTFHLIKEWGTMIFNTPEYKLYPRNAKAKEQLVKSGVSLNDILNNPNLIFDYLDQDSAPVIKNQNGCYIYPYILKNKEKIGHHLGRFYVSLAPENICEFINKLMEKLPDGQFSFKFFSCEKAERVIIYPHTQALFTMCEAITTIRKENPELFVNADNKWFTTPLVEGVSYASDLNFTFSEATYPINEKLYL